MENSPFLAYALVTITALFAVAAYVVNQALVRLCKLDPNCTDHRLPVARAVGKITWVAALSIALISYFFWNKSVKHHQEAVAAQRKAIWPTFEQDAVWQAPDVFLAQTDAEHDLIAYGRNLIAFTQDYFGPNGEVKANQINGLNCQSCHLDAGTKAFGNNYSAVASTYPLFRARSGSTETIAKRVNDCFARSLNGAVLDSTSREMLAITAYIKWLGTGVPKDTKPKGSGLKQPAFLNRPALPDSGSMVYQAKCASCHGMDGQGMKIPNSERYYPPLWGQRSYNEAAGLYRLSRFAGYVKSNMPLGASYDNPQLTDAEAWDLAAFVNSQPRPKHPYLASDWPDISKKPFDHPFGPYADTFPVNQHKYGPFQPIVDAQPKSQSKSQSK
jgi:thiosulfate dehydrogenase